jgi:hypothetical protein
MYAVVSAPNLLFDMKIREDIAKLPKKDKYTKNFEFKLIFITNRNMPKYEIKLQNLLKI